MADKHHSVEHSRAALDILATMTFTDDDTSVFEDDDVAQASMFAKIKPKSQKKSKQAKKAAIKNNVDVKPFDMLGISIPTTQKEFNITISDILTAQKSTLEVIPIYPECLRRFLHPPSFIFPPFDLPTWPTPSSRPSSR